MSTSIHVTWGSECELEPHHVWPDGDVPEVIDAEAVITEMKVACRTPLELIRDWELDLPRMELTVSVSRPNPHWRPIEPLFPEHAPERFVRTQATWTGW